MGLRRYAPGWGPWINMTLINSWVQSGAQVPQYRKNVQTGHLQFRGSVAGGSATACWVPPVGYKPSSGATLTRWGVGTNPSHTSYATIPNLNAGYNGASAVDLTQVCDLSFTTYKATS